MFNVFSAQKNYTTKVDKFGFDKVIFVCDIHNIKKLYVHKYGEGVDFWGYISKFVSEKVFHFNNKDLVSRSLTSFLTNMEYNQNLDNDVILSSNNEEANNNKNLVKFILKMLINTHYLSLRDITKIRNLSLTEIETNKKTSFQILCIYIDTILGSNGKFKDILESLSTKGIKYTYNSFNEKTKDIIPEYNSLFKLLFKPSTTDASNLSDTYILYDNFGIVINSSFGKVSTIKFTQGKVQNIDIIKFLLLHIKE